MNSQVAIRHSSETEGKRFNPSNRRERVEVALLASVALLIATYMGLYQWGVIDHVWDPIFGAQTSQVLNSNVSQAIRRWIGIPDAILGSLAYMGDVVLALAGSTRRWRSRPWLVILYGLNVIPLGVVSVVLVGLQGTVVGAWCFPCIFNAAISLLLIYLAHDEIRVCVKYLHRIWRNTRSCRILWKAVRGRPTPAGQRVAEALSAGNGPYNRRSSG